MKKRILGGLLALCILLGLVPAMAGLAADETVNVTVKAAAGGKISADGASFSDSVVVAVAKGGTLDDKVQYKPDEGYKLEGVIASTVIKKIAASDVNTFVIDDEGNLYTAGDNSCGQLARKLGSYVFEDSVLTKVSTSAKIIDVAMGRDHIVVLDENGEVWTAGCNQYGALGIDENAGKYWYGTYIETLRKVTVGDGSVKIKAVAAGQSHTILIDENGGVWTAGYNSDGQLGRSENVNSGTPNAVFKKADGLENVKIADAAGGTAYTVLLDENGHVWTAGNNVYGQLGRQTAGNEDAAFEKVTDGIADVKITAIAAGNSHTVLLDESGHVWTAGCNLYGELGREMTGSANTTFEKADLQGAEGARFIAAGAGNTIVIDTDGNTRTCGIKGFGQLGRNTENTENPELFKVTDGIGSTKMMAAAAGNRHSILLDEGGGLWSCGGNQNGQLCRNGDLKKSETFAAVTDGMIRTITFDEMKNTVITSDRVFTVTSAVREKVQLEYDLGGGNWVDGFTPRDFAYKDEELVLPDASNVKKTGYTFAGWETSSLTADPIKCSAKWTANTYTVTFDGNGGTVAQETMRVTYGEPPDQMPIPRYKGYFFLGWYDRQQHGRQYSDKYGHSTTRYDKAEDCTLYAMWEEAPLCTVTFDPNGGTLTGAATCVEKQNECIREPSLDEWPVREGHNFLGWYTDAACKPEQKWDFDDPIPGNMTLYAGWEILSYVIRVRPENGKPDILIDQNYDTAVTPPTLTRVGYIFAGWDTPFPEKMPAKILTITARWTVCDHSGHTGANPTCMTSVICTACGGTIAALGHDFSVEQHDENTHWKKCSRCDAKNDENPHDWDSGKVTVKPTCMTEGEKIYTCDKCGATKNEPIQASGHSWDQAWQHNATHHWHECLNADCDVKDNDSAKDGYGAHTGGTATCIALAVCASCHQPYGEKNPENHEGGTQQWTTRNATAHEKKWSCCGAVIVASEAHEWLNGECSECGYACLHDDTDKNHICDICGKVISNHEDADNNHVCDYCGKIISNHAGGKATCKDKAACEVCGKAYGELDPKNHTDLEHIPAKAASEKAAGNIEYWYCSGCGKYFTDAAATKEITEADTVKEKLPDSPKTGESSRLWLWLALLLVSGGAVTGAAVFGKKRGFAG